MINQICNTSNVNEMFSRAMQKRMEMMLLNADRLFSIGWLRKQVWQELINCTKEKPATEYGIYKFVLQKSNERLFMWQFLSVCYKSLDDIKRIIENAYDDKSAIEELLEERDDLIREFAFMPLSRTWENVKNDKESWCKFASRIPFGEVSKQDEISHFFYILDRIGIITDIVCRRAHEYELTVDYSFLDGYERQKRRGQLNDELLVKAFEEWASFLNSQSAWTVAFCVLRDEFGYTNASQFERDLAQLKFNKMLPDCPSGTISKTLSNNKYMTRPITKWPVDKKYTKSAQTLKSIIKKLLES